jgi:asparagine synthase (glutamine-hydrolysing)
VGDILPGNGKNKSMCGIIAITGRGLNIDEYNVSLMLESLGKRGPDGSGTLNRPNCFLAHRRLSIVDIEKGGQPMAHDSLSISFNGEIYNFRQLKDELSAAGFVFKTNSDTEVVLAAYKEWAQDCLTHLDGMFAFCIWDSRTETLFLARDRIGKKPLYYSIVEKDIIVASEIKAIKNSGRVELGVDYGAIDFYLKNMYIEPNKSVYTNILQLPPAHYGVYKNGVLETFRYWSLKKKECHASYEEAKSEVHRLIKKAVKKRILSSDVEIGSFLSGGVDSSLVSIIASSFTEKSLKTFGVSYKMHDELPYIEDVATKIGSELKIVHVPSLDLCELNKIVDYFDEPHADTSDVAQHLLSQVASQAVKVVLSGDGADELFLGYKWHITGTETPITRRLEHICAFDMESRKKLWINKENVVSRILALIDKSSPGNSMDQVTLFDLNLHLPGQILSKVDRASMMHGLEVRCPFLDIELIEYVYNLPYEFKVGPDGQKIILRDILCDYMPREFAYRKKQGFGAPIWNWLREEGVRERVYHHLTEGSKIRNFLVGSEIDEYLKDFYLNTEGHERAGQRVWVLFCLELWARNNL